MAYLGKTPSQAVRSRYYYTAAGSETSLSGADDNNNTLIFTDGNYVDVYLNGVLLVSDTDYNTTTTNTIGGLAALAANDIVEIVVYDTFSVFGGEVKGDFNITNGTLTADFEGTFTFRAKNTSGAGISKGTPVYISGHSGNNAEIGVADANDPAKMPSFGIAAEAIGNNLTGKVVSYGNLKQIDTSAFAVGDELYVSNTGTLTATRPSGTSDAVQKVAKVIRSHASVGQLFVMGAGRTNDIPNATSNSIQFADNAKAQFGASNDLQIYHDGSHSYVADSGTGNLQLSTNGIAIKMLRGNGEVLGSFNIGDSVDLYYNNAKKFETTATGVDVTGNIDFSGGILASNGSVQFVMDKDNNGGEVFVWGHNASNATTNELMRLTSGGNVGIGTASPESALQVTGAVNTTPDSSGVHLGMDSNYATIELAGSDGGQLDFPNAANTDYRGRIRYTASDNKMAFFAGGAGTQTMTVTNTSVGIGTASPNEKLTIDSGAISFLGSLSTPSIGAGIFRPANNTLGFVTGNSERMRLESSGYLLVGKTSSNIGTAGSEVTPLYISATRADNSPLFLNRTSSDGSIITFRKDNSTVGIIGNSGSSLILSNGYGSQIKLGNNEVVPTSSGKDLGNPTDRWRDLYLSGGAYLGGTGSANHLDDYEEGTWTPTFVRSSTNPSYTAYYNHGTYVKIGRLVYYHCIIIVTAVSSQGSGNALVSGLPFNGSTSTSLYAQVGTIGYNDTWDAAVTRVYVQNSNQIQITPAGITQSNYGGTLSTGYFSAAGWYTVA